MEPHERIILPLDVSDIKKAENLVDILSPYVGVFKIGFESIYSTMVNLLLTRSYESIGLINRVRNLAKKIGPEKAFLDVKLADIPNTVENTVKTLSLLGVKMINIHVSAGERAIKTAVANKGVSKLFGVTVLTSIDKDECFSIFGADPVSKVDQFARILVENGADGVICAPKEGLMLRRYRYFDKLIIACPNIRPEWSATKEERERVKDDQNVERQMTPAEAIKDGIDMLVIGRPITKPPVGIGGPVEAAKRIAEEITQAQKEI
ncbi:MAG: orotidine-5'-phosphate decarboxylase [Candidatus Staskawiczbacteria bacterium]|nr:orotidine-5'-phosphate decarboxylase [Candidatus Staskawiczbacteria bacterium]MBI3337524.1 orotidine-5'-phosphate decarboxylase [Candidatus Staskawiczbacteria bacterium]